MNVTVCSPAKGDGRLSVILCKQCYIEILLVHVVHTVTAAHTAGPHSMSLEPYQTHQF
jgi:hypothetical protein